ncbi:hypothetical protein, partial [Kribbella antibiotica]|uniref:hypothetical protein n=1 Tax=Kribbella antibiotica TaxID=190195 RepID=UPI001EDECB63
LGRRSAGNVAVGVGLVWSRPVASGDGWSPLRPINGGVAGRRGGWAAWRGQRSRALLSGVAGLWLPSMMTRPDN